MSKLQLGAFSLSLSVKDIHASKAFYEDLGFEQMGGDLEKNYLIMKNDTAVIGLFQGMFDDNLLTFNPGWDSNAQEVNPFDDVRAIQKHAKAKGLNIVKEADESTSGPEHMIVTDPDGNVILIDQHR